MFKTALCCLLLWLPASVSADTLKLAVAANFKTTLEMLVEQFDPQQQHDIVISSASTGVLYTQIHQGAPFDIFFAADRARPERLEAEGLGLANSRMTYAVGQLALWQPAGQPTSLHSLNSTRLAIANPKTAPYGLAAQQALMTTGHWQDMQRVQGSNIAQTFQFVHSGNVTQGLVAHAQLRQLDIPANQWVVIDARLYAPIEQQLIRLQHSADNPLAEQFIHFMRSADARHLIEHSGYGPADAAH